MDHEAVYLSVCDEDLVRFCVLVVAMATVEWAICWMNGLVVYALESPVRILPSD